MALVPESLGVPRTGFFQRCELVANSPAAIPALDHVHEPLFVTVVAIVVAGQQIAISVNTSDCGLRSPHA